MAVKAFAIQNIDNARIRDVIKPRFYWLLVDFQRSPKALIPKLEFFGRFFASTEIAKLVILHFFFAMAYGFQSPILTTHHDGQRIFDVTPEFGEGHSPFFPSFVCRHLDRGFS
jgi:hypothetical protein